jgi:CRISPR/Cas system type I-B associated protein Csh2 (Cas7 group RAMP superfamily)
MEKTMQVTLNQAEANKILRALEMLEEDLLASAQPDEARQVQLIWNKVFDGGMNNGFGIRKEVS